MRENIDKIPEDRLERRVEKPESILYHNVINLEYKENEMIDFFAPKSDATKAINEQIENYVEFMDEASRLLKDEHRCFKIKEILSQKDVFAFPQFYMPAKEEIKKILSAEEYPHLCKFLTTYHRLLNFADILNMVSGTYDFTYETGMKDKKFVKVKDLKKIKFIRDRSFFLTKEDESFKGWGLISFNMEYLLKQGFVINEADNEAANDIKDNVNTERNIRQYISSFHRIKTPHDCLKYKGSLRDNYDACTTEVVHKPYCPEYLVMPPSYKLLKKYIQDNKKEMETIFSKYKVIPAELSGNNKPRLITTDNKDFKLGQKIDIDDLDKNKYFNQTELYKILVNVLFNEAITDIKAEEK